MRIYILLILIISWQTVVAQQEDWKNLPSHKVDVVYRSPECKKFLTDIKSCTPGKCTLQRKIDGAPWSSFFEILGSDKNGICRINVSSYSKNSEDEKIKSMHNCNFAQKDANYIGESISPFIENSKLILKTQKCMETDKSGHNKKVGSCGTMIGNQVYYNIFKLGILGGQCKPLPRPLEYKNLEVSPKCADFNKGLLSCKAGTCRIKRSIQGKTYTSDYRILRKKNDLCLMEISESHQNQITPINHYSCDFRQEDLDAFKKLQTAYLSSPTIQVVYSKCSDRNAKGSKSSNQICEIKIGSQTYKEVISQSILSGRCKTER